MTTVVAKTFAKAELNKGDANTIGVLVNKMQMGTMFSPVKSALTGLVAAGAHNLTDVAHGSLPALASLISLRVTAATTGSTVGSYVLTDAAGTALTANTSAVTGLAKISDDGTTITFVTADVTAFVIEYMPRSAIDLATTEFPVT